MRDTKERGIKVLLHYLSKQLLASFGKAQQQCYDQMGDYVTCKDNVMMALFKKCFDVTPDDRMGLFSRRVSLLAAKGPDFCRSFVEIQYSNCCHILFLIQMKNRVQNFLGNHILKNNVRLDAESYCNNAWNLFYIATLKLLDNAETSLKWWGFHKQKLQLLQNQNGAQWHYWNVCVFLMVKIHCECLSCLTELHFSEGKTFHWEILVLIWVSGAGCLFFYFYFYSRRIPTVVLKSVDISSENRALERDIFQTKSPLPQVAVGSSSVDSLCTVKQLPHFTPATVVLHLWSKWFICEYGKSAAARGEFALRSSSWVRIG